MAWWALYKWFIVFRKRPFINYIEAYKNKLFNEWYDNLSVEEKEEYQRKLELKCESDKKKK